MKYVFLLGLNQDCSSYQSTIQNMKDVRQEDCIVIDYHQFQDPIQSFEALSFQLEMYLLELSKEEPIHLIGLSLGAILALKFALNYSSRIVSLVLIACVYKVPNTLLKVQNKIMVCMPEGLFEDDGLSKQEIISLTKSMYGIDGYIGSV